MFPFLTRTKTVWILYIRMRDEETVFKKWVSKAHSAACFATLSHFPQTASGLRLVWHIRDTSGLKIACSLEGYTLHKQLNAQQANNSKASFRAFRKSHVQVPRPEPWFSTFQVSALTDHGATWYSNFAISFWSQPEIPSDGWQISSDESFFEIDTCLHKKVSVSPSQPFQSKKEKIPNLF